MCMHSSHVITSVGVATVLRVNVTATRITCTIECVALSELLTLHKTFGLAPKFHESCSIASIFVIALNSRPRLMD